MATASKLGLKISLALLRTFHPILFNSKTLNSSFNVLLLPDLLCPNETFNYCIYFYYSWMNHCTRLTMILKV